MPIRADQLKEKEDYQKLILDSLHDNNGFRIRPNTEYKPGLAMDIGMLLEFLESTQHDTMEQLRRMYKASCCLQEQSSMKRHQRNL